MKLQKLSLFIFCFIHCFSIKSSESSPNNTFRSIGCALGGIVLGSYVKSVSKPHPENEKLHTFENKQSPESSLKPGQA